jgi:hypothetical protein
LLSRDLKEAVFSASGKAYRRMNAARNAFIQKRAVTPEMKKYSACFQRLRSPRGI